MKLIIAIIVFLISTFSYSQELWHENWDHYELDGSWEIKSSLDGWSNQNDSLIGKKIYKYKHWIQVPEDKPIHSTRECQILATDFGKDGNNDSLYFSREPIPSPWQGLEEIPMYMQTGIIAFRRDALLQFNQEEETRLEQIESVDMNRVLENGGRIRMVLTELTTIGVDTPEELESAERLMKNDPTLARYMI